MKKSFFIILLTSLLFFVGCSSSVITTKAELVHESTNYNSAVKEQNQLLNRLKKELTASVSLYDKMTTNTSLEELKVSLEARDNTIAAISKQNTSEKKSNDSFKKTIKQKNTHFPLSELRQVTQSQEIAFLDRETFMKYLTSTKESEKDLMALFKHGEPSEDDLQAAIESTTLYYSALMQQIEIWQVNTHRVQNDTKNLIKSLK